MQRRARTLKQALPLLLIFGAGGCQYDPYADQYTHSKPKKADLVGTYVLKSQSLTETPISQLKSQKGVAPRNHKLILRADGTYQTVNLPIWVENHAPGISDAWVIKRFDSGSGKWSLDVCGSIDDGVRSRDEWGITLSSLFYDSYAGHIPLVGSVAGEKTSYSMIFGYDDPDSGDVMIYERQDVAKPRG